MCWIWSIICNRIIEWQTIKNAQQIINGLSMNNNKDKKVIPTSDLKKSDIIYDYNIPIQDYKDPTYIENPYQIGSKTMDGDLFIPLNYSIDTKLRWLEGMCDTCGIVDNGRIKLFCED